MAEKKKFKQNDNNMTIAYCRLSSHSQNEASSTSSGCRRRRSPRPTATA